MYSLRMNTNMLLQEQVTEKKPPVMGYLPHPTKALISSSPNQFKLGDVNSGLKKSLEKQGKNADTFANGGSHGRVKLGQKLTKTMKEKLSLGARLLQIGGIDKIFRRLFSVRDDEKLFKAYQCCLSTTAGPIAGLLFISTHKIAFCSQRSIKITSPSGDLVRAHYKVSIPLTRIKKANQSENSRKPSQKYMEIVTVDDFDFWFMGFLNHKKAFSCLQQAISHSFDQF